MSPTLLTLLCLACVSWWTSSIHGWTTRWSLHRKTVVRLPEDHNATQIHNHFMDLALEQARKAGRKNEVPIGAVLIQRNQDGSFAVLSQACNLVETRHDASAHAELLALQQGAKRIKNWRLSNTTLYTSLEPCPMCLAACQAFRVSSIVYAAPDLRLGAIETHIRLLDIPHPFHTIGEVVPGVQQNKSADLLRGFFRERRKQTTPKDTGATWRAKLNRLLSFINVR
jgi:tRNA(adenine34) deaminase